jgi:two-component system, LuxR family, sensor kinase FixL
VFPVELSVGEAATREGRQFIGILRDLRAKKEAEDRMRELQGQLVHMARVSAIDEMGAALAHELNQPLTAIMLYLQALQRALSKADTSLPAGHLEVFGKAVREAERAGAIIQRMRKFVEKRESQRAHVPVHGLLDEAVELTRVGSRALNVRISRDYDPHLPEVEIDPVQFQQVIVNLVRNALDATRAMPEPEIVIRTRRVGERIRISIIDNGPGVPPDLAEDLFKAFSSSKERGLGIGLAISRAIAQSHGGDLSVDPGGGGQGASFHVTLPAVAQPAEGNDGPVS